MVVTGNFRRAPDPSCSYFTVANIHIKNAFAKKAVCLNRTFAPHPATFARSWALSSSPVTSTRVPNAKLSMVLATTSAISPLEAAFSFASVPWHTSGVTPLWGSGGESHGNRWPECCGFVLLPESQNQWFIMRRGSYNVIPAAIGQMPTDQTWHYEQWLHLKLAGRKRRRDAPPSDSNS